MGSRLGRVMRYFAALAICATLCAGLSYALVRYITRDMTLYRRADERAVHESVALRNASRALAELSNDWFDRAAHGPSTALERWIDKDFEPRLNDLWQQLVHFEYAGEASQALLRAAESLRVSVAMPQDGARRQKAAELVLEAILEAERRVGSLGVSPNLLPPPVPAPAAK